MEITISPVGVLPLNPWYIEQFHIKKKRRKMSKWIIPKYNATVCEIRMPIYAIAGAAISFNIPINLIFLWNLYSDETILYRVQ